MDAEPKSASFTCPGSVSRIFPAFTSLSRGENIISETHKQPRGAADTPSGPETLTGESCYGSVSKPTLAERRE